MTIKIAVIRWFLCRYDLDQLKLIVNEFTANKSRARADLMAIVGEDILAVEIKSQNDRLSRLEKQVTYLLQLYNRVEIFTTDRHLDASFQLCRHYRIGLHVFRNERIQTLLRGRRRKIQNGQLDKNLFPLNIQRRRDYSPSEEYYRSFLLEKHFRETNLLREIHSRPACLDPEMVRRLNPHYVIRRQYNSRRIEYIDNIISNFTLR